MDGKQNTDSAERLREVVLDLDLARERERELREEASALLTGLAAITDAKSPSEIFERLLEALRAPFGFEAAMVLRPSGDELVVAITTDPLFAEARFAATGAFARALRGRVSTHLATATIPEWQAQSEAIRSRVGAALCLPLQGERERALVVFTRETARAFQPRHEQLARRFLPLVTQALRDAERRAQLSRANGDMRLVLDNVAQGLLTVAPNRAIVGERSAIVDRWFGPVETGTTLDALLARKDLVLGEELRRSWTELVRQPSSPELGAVDKLPISTKLASLPRELRTAGLVLRIDYQPVPTLESWTHMLVVLSDITAEVERALLEAQAKDAQRKNELSIAQHVQTFILPRELRAPGLEIAARMLPAEEVGGDYYDVITVDDGCWMAIGDVSGHGLRAGLLMLMVQSSILTLVREDRGASPSEVVCAANRMLFENTRERLREEEHMTLSAIRYTNDGTIELAGAHEDPVIYRATTGERELCPTQGTWIGAMRDISPFTRPSRHKLEPGDMLWLYTDGIIEARDRSGRHFGIDRMCAIIREHHAESVARIRDRLFDALLDWSPVPIDDVTLLGARYIGASA